VKTTIGGTNVEFTLREREEATEAFESARHRRNITGIGLKNESSDPLHLETRNIRAETDFTISFDCLLCGTLKGYSMSSGNRFRRIRYRTSSDMESKIDVQENICDRRRPSI
jgi:hypothetical protein